MERSTIDDVSVSLSPPRSLSNPPSHNTLYFSLSLIPTGCLFLSNLPLSCLIACYFIFLALLISLHYTYVSPLTIHTHIHAYKQSIQCKLAVTKKPSHRHTKIPCTVVIMFVCFSMPYNYYLCM